MTRHIRIDFKRDRKITEKEADRVVAIYKLWRNHDYFVAKDVKESIHNLSSQIIQRYLWIGRELGLFAFKIKPVGNVPAIYHCIAHDDAMAVLKPFIATSKQYRKTVDIVAHDTPCELANVLGFKPIQHDCNPRLVINDFRGGKIERARGKVFVSGEWRL